MWVSLAPKEKMMRETKIVNKAGREEVEQMFNSIAGYYDFLNHFLSLGTDRWWRRRAISTIGRHLQPVRILDVATGTGDLAIASLRLNPVKVTGIDISDGMLELGRRKIAEHHLDDKIELLKGDSEAINFADDTFDVVMVAFGVRNFEHTLTGLNEMFRVLRPRGMIMVLEFSRPSLFPFKQIYNFYFTRVLPWIGRRVSGDNSAYKYLPESVMSFADNEVFLKLLREAGFVCEKQKKLSGGIASIYYGFKQ
ncbi:MAG TPA: bifunctional demethylmenaquinone methyltransferase/2-methoxy-6-polyprenyl-1,4-benzoquinol methylase UbiE [Bacteroidales bacterium]|nr:bifunctional demethylmenaquinone methyltransferase/2-methoxy-6-polyprenyl-1,4-benzoquinol methylase UbiE [Bacteroidales bacterium]